ncbi:MAG: hypothetical protein AVDCRST_MAG69-34 [uncultured Solirubrobacteraceae bacterium]|uniref:Peptidase MA-like domain-containing protein n=1 Tax=uncultured Solirubrobacteraceae bacterium TaxID=1162706 RepID=A0A6J4RCL4_9ACTN|nr:MAG: hypothetical protein AVDCRST_MAG69-34 [uncultured Solirubrobacteraceae bacterium]
MIGRSGSGGGAALAAILLGLLVGGCGGGDVEMPESQVRPSAAGETTVVRRPTAADDRAALRTLLRRRFEALERGRPSAYAATAIAARRPHDAADVRRADGLGLRGLETRVSALRMDGDRAALTARMTYRMAGAPGRWEYVQRIHARRTTQGWRVTRARTSDPQPPWELAAYRTVDTRHFRVLVPEGVSPADADLEGLLESAYDEIRARLPGRLARRYVVLIATDGGELGAMAPSVRGVSQLSAITDLAVRTVGPAERVTEVVSLRVLIPWDSFLAASAETRRRVLAHELAHAALAPVTSGRTPAWLQEAIALYVSGDRRAAPDDLPTGALAASGATRARLGRLARPDAMSGLDGEELSAAYRLSSSAGFYIAARYGPDRLLALLNAYNDESYPGDAGRTLSSAVTRRTLGVGLDRLERDIGDWEREGAPALGG